VQQSDQAAASLETDLLAELVSKKHAVLDRMRDLAQRQVELIVHCDMTRLLSVLAAKQNMLIELRKVEQQLEPFRDQAPESRRWRSTIERQRCRQTAEKCEQLLSEILKIEKQSESDLAGRRDQVATQLNGATSAAEATKAYTRPTNTTSHSFDLSSER